jgi:hypothetical protein
MSLWTRQDTCRGFGLDSPRTTYPFGVDTPPVEVHP